MGRKGRGIRLFQATIIDADVAREQFLAQGYKVGRVDQCETALGAELRVKDGKAKGGKPVTASNGKAIVRRELRSVLTGGTIVDGSLLTDDLANHCVAIKVSQKLILQQRIGQ